MSQNRQSYVPDFMLVDVEIVTPRNSEGKPLITPAYTLTVQHACDYMLGELGDLSRFVKRFWVRFPLDDKGKVVQWVGITAFVATKNGGETHLTKWFRFSESLTETIPIGFPIRQEMAAGLLEPLRQFVASRQA